VFDQDSRGAVTVTRVSDSTRAALSRLADFFNTPVTPPG